MGKEETKAIELKKIMDELFKRDDILDAKRDELYHMIDDFAERIG